MRGADRKIRQKDSGVGQTNAMKNRPVTSWGGLVKVSFVDDDCRNRCCCVFLVPPIIEDQSTDYTVIEERDIILPCRVSGVPQPTVHWIRDNQTIASDDLHYRVLRTHGLAIPIVRWQFSLSVCHSRYQVISIVKYVIPFIKLGTLWNMPFPLSGNLHCQVSHPHCHVISIVKYAIPFVR